MRLQVLINYYNEDINIVKRFLDSLETQENVEFEAIIAGDGGVELDESLFKDYSYPITYMYLPHSGVCHTRNVLLDEASADYVMFCDIDDMFSSSDGLSSLLEESEGMDIVGSNYESEQENLETYTIEKDVIRVHGKIFRRYYLIRWDIRFPDELEYSGDMMFMWLAYALTKNFKWIDNNFYIWKYNPTSVTRNKKNFLVEAYDYTVTCYMLLAENLLQRKRYQLYLNLLSTFIPMLYLDTTGLQWRMASKELQEKGREITKKALQQHYQNYLTIPDDKRQRSFDFMKNYKKYQGVVGEYKGIQNWYEQMFAPHNALIIGYGVVGQNLFKELHQLKPVIYDKYKYIGLNDGHYHIAFICVDTPKRENIDCDITEVYNAIQENDADVYVIKSTVLPGVTEGLKSMTGKRIVFSPEYYGGTQHCNNYNFDFTILGGEKNDCIEVIQQLQKVYDGRHQFRITDAKTAELVKYMENAYLATNVSFCNQFYNIAEDAGVNYEELRELFILDPRVNESHTFVYRDKPYWDSHCLNKDMQTIANAYDATLLKDVINFNNEQKGKIM